MAIKRKIRKLLFVAHDAGGADSLMPVIQRLRRDRAFEILNLLAGPAKLIGEKYGIEFIAADGFDVAKLKKTVIDYKPDLIFTGTSSGVRIEKKMLKIARRLAILIVAILDFWINYNLQFSFNKKSKIVPTDLPDYILVMDDVAKRGMIKEGFPAQKLIITGNPHFERFKKFPAPSKKATRNIVFIDQPISTLVKKEIHEPMGYTEIKVFSDIVKALEDLDWRGNLIIKFHPGSNNQTRFDATIERSKIRIIKSKKSEELDDILKNSRLVLGMTSMALFEAALGGKFVLSYQPNLRRRLDPLISNRLGLSHFVYRKRNLKKVLKKILAMKKPSDLHKRLINYYTKQNATSKIIKFIKSLC